MSDRTPRLRVLATIINAEFPDLEATVERVMVSTDRHPKGVRWRIPGRGRQGNKLTVQRRGACFLDAPVYAHSAAETYRRNEEVVRWIEAERKRRADASAANGRPEKP